MAGTVAAMIERSLNESAEPTSESWGVTGYRAADGCGD